jgi:hypothetical protein
LLLEPSKISRAYCATVLKNTGSHMTSRWREVDSNFQFRAMVSSVVGAMVVVTGERRSITILISRPARRSRTGTDKSSISSPVTPCKQVAVCSSALGQAKTIDFLTRIPPMKPQFRPPLQRFWTKIQ